MPRSRQYGKEDLFYRANRRRGLIYGIVQDAAELHENPQFKHREYFAGGRSSGRGQSQLSWRTVRYVENTLVG